MKIKNVLLFFFILFLINTDKILAGEKISPKTVYLEKKVERLLGDNALLLERVVIAEKQAQLGKKGSDKLRKENALYKQENERYKKESSDKTAAVELENKIKTLRLQLDECKKQSLDRTSSISELEKKTESLSQQLRECKNKPVMDLKVDAFEKGGLKEKTGAPTKESEGAKKAAFYNLGFLYAKNKELDKAIEEYNNVLAIDYKDKDAHFNLGYIYALKDDFTSAIKEYEEVLKIAPADKETCFNLAIIYQKNIRDEKKAKQYYEEFLKKDGKR